MAKQTAETTDVCPCLEPETHFCGFERKAIGADKHYGEVTIWTCKKCGRKWLHYLIEYEYLTAAGRIFTGVISADALAGITADNAVDAFEAMDWYFRGGSAFGSNLLRTTGPLKPWLVPFPGKQPRRSVMTNTRVVLMLLVASCFPTVVQAQWSSFSDAKGRFKVLLPGKPVQTADSPPTFSLSTASGIYVISYTGGHEGADWAQMVNSERDVTIQGLKGKVIREKEISLGDFRGKSVTFECNLPSGPFSGPAAGQMRIYFNGHRYYMLVGLAPKGCKCRGNYQIP